MHLAARNGDKDFVTMIIEEACDMDANFLTELIDKGDSEALTPLYLLCESGHKKA